MAEWRRALARHDWSKMAWRRTVAEQDDKSPLTDGQMPPGEAAEDMAGAAETGPEALQAELEQVTRELADTREQMLRVAADAQNIRRRAEKDEIGRASCRVRRKTHE